jgi:LacI family transcriptional regulator
VAVTIYDIAEKSGVSIATVSRVFNNHPRVSERTRATVFAVARRLGYQPHVSAQSLARRKAHLISAVIPMLTNYFFIEVMRGMQDQLVESEYDLVVFSAPSLDDVDGQLERALQKGLSAGVLLFSTPLTRGRATLLQRSEQPVVLVDSMHPEFDSVAIDNELGGYVATKHLLELGFERIGLILANPVSVPAARRRDGFMKAMHEAGVGVDEAWICVSSDEHQHGYTEEVGFRAMRDLIERQPRPDAVFVASDIQALGALQAASEAGVRVPEDLAIVGFDDIKISHYVGLSTLRQPMYEMGRLAIDRLLARIRDPLRPTSQTVFSPELVRRGTTARQVSHAAPEVASHG